MFRTVPLSIIILFHCTYSNARKLSPNLYDIYHCCVHSEKFLIVDRGTVETCRVFSKNKFEKLVLLVGFIIRIYRDARSPEIQNHKLKAQ